MNRCHMNQVPSSPGTAPRSACIALAASLLLPLGLLPGAAGNAHAQETIRREAPKDVTLARMTIVAPPVIELDGKTDRLSPGSRIRDTRNMIVLSASLAGQTIPVVYRRDPAGLVHEAWILTADEYKKLAGVSSGSRGVQQFLELLALIFGAR